VTERRWHTQAVEEALSALESDPDGLTSDEARARLERHGRNRLRTEDDERRGGGRGGAVRLLQGAPEVLLERCTRVWSGRGAKPASDEERDQVLRLNDELAEEGLRVLGLAYRAGPGKQPRTSSVTWSSWAWLGWPTRP
jgi:magnesium-transporting ATPase (P-type)